MAERLIKYLLLLTIVSLFPSCYGGGGADIGNPITGTVKIEEDGGSTRVAAATKNRKGARVILSKRGADPGLAQDEVCGNDGSFEICSKPIFFDTTFTDENGVYRFDTVYPGEYVLVAEYDEYLGLKYIECNAYEELESVELTCKEPARLAVETYDVFDPDEPHFIGVRVAGTGYMDSVDAEGVMVIKAVPEVSDDGALDLILYRSDGEKKYYSGFTANSGCQTELYLDPFMPEDAWTPHICIRNGSGRPYIYEYYISSESEPLIYDNEAFDFEIGFSHSMDAISTSKAITVFSSDTMATLRSLKWMGGNTVYIALCIKDGNGECRIGADRFRDNVTYGIAVDTTARTTNGIFFAHPDTIRFNQ